MIKINHGIEKASISVDMKKGDWRYSKTLRYRKEDAYEDDYTDLNKCIDDAIDILKNLKEKIN